MQITIATATSPPDPINLQSTGAVLSTPNVAKTIDAIHSSPAEFDDDNKANTAGERTKVHEQQIGYKHVARSKEYSANANYTKDLSGRTSLHYAVINDHMDIFSALVGNGGALFQDAAGLTPLHLAAIYRRSTIGKILVQYSDLDIKDRFGRTALHYALMHKDFKLSHALWENTHPNIQDGKGCTPLHYAVLSHDRLMVYWLLRDGDPNIKDKLGRTPLYLAAKICNLQILQVLMQRKDIRLLDKLKAGTLSIWFYAVDVCKSFSSTRE